MEGCPFFCSWSGGKDSCLALYRAIQSKGIPKALFTMLTEDGERSGSHGLPVDLIKAQSEVLGIPLVMCESSWSDYEDNFLSVIRRFKEEGIECGVFGDIDLEAHLEWVERVCSIEAIRPYEPLWKEARQDILNEFLDLGFEATVIVTKQGTLDNSFLGRTLDLQVIADMVEAGIDASGEEGEYHTVVTDGPIFSFPLYLEEKEKVFRDGYWFLDVARRTGS
jgi:diphthine-ammonia ligase